VSEVRERGEREGGRGNRERQGGVVSLAAGQTLESLPSGTKGGGRCQLSCKFKELLIPIQR